MEVIYIVKAHQLFIQPDYIVPSNQEKQLGSSHTGQSRHDDAPVWLFLTLSSIMCIHMVLLGLCMTLSPENMPDFFVCIKRTQQLVKSSSGRFDSNIISCLYVLSIFKLSLTQIIIILII